MSGISNSGSPSGEQPSKTSPATIAPSLVHTNSSPSQYRYSRDELLSLAQTPHIKPPAPERLIRFEPILRNPSFSLDTEVSLDPSSEIQIKININNDKEKSLLKEDTPPEVFDGKSVSDILPIPKLPLISERPSVSRSSSLDLDFLDPFFPTSLPLQLPEGNTKDGQEAPVVRWTELQQAFANGTQEKPAAAIMIDFTNPDPFQPNSNSISPPSLIPNKPRGSMAFQGPPGVSGNGNSVPFPSSVMSRKSSISSLINATSIPVKQVVRPSERPGSWIRSRSNSNASISSTGASPGGAESLNPFAPPFPLINASSSPVDKEKEEEQPGSLPLPKVLPANLPARPGPIAPVFIKRESAALPMPMSLPEVAPMGRSWEGEAAMSGNDLRRRASQMGLPALPIKLDGSSGSAIPTSLGVRKPSMLGMAAPVAAPVSEVKASSMGEQRPERLVKLGQRLRQSVAERGVQA